MIHIYIYHIRTRRLEVYYTTSTVCQIHRCLVLCVTYLIYTTNHKCCWVDFDLCNKTHHLLFQHIIIIQQDLTSTFYLHCSLLHCNNSYTAINIFIRQKIDEEMHDFEVWAFGVSAWWGRKIDVAAERWVVRVRRQKSVYYVGRPYYLLSTLLVEDENWMWQSHHTFHDFL